MQLPYTYRVTQYDPRDWDAAGRYSGDVAWTSDEGPVEAAHVEAVAWFLEELGVTHLEVRDPMSEGLDPDEAPLPPEHPLAGLFGRRLEGYHDGALVDVAGVQVLVRVMLRRAGAWCRLEAPGAFVHVWYESVYLGAAEPCPRSLTRALAAGLDCEEVAQSPNDPAPTDVSPWEDRRAVDAAFWAEVDALLEAYGAVMVEEWGPWPRWHRLTSEHPRVGLRPRAHVFVWPDLPDGVGSVLASPPAPERVESLVWVAADGRARQRWVEGDAPPDLRTLLAGATRAAWRGRTNDPPLLEAWLPDADGVIRTRLDS
ncbi:hypothetical protein AB6N24_16455 [Cellulomonas sp. 179-A 4D5 NHS]|uniref:hypothetical protein n=1 Tax=Cellulomonas sp. 179-A 4D5 NHS TaxID=3142378 RepID=UPI00399FA5C3